MRHAVGLTALATDVRSRSYGRSGPLVAVLHGGPGAIGYMAPVARGLTDAFRVLEPFQRRAGGQALTVARHVADLRELLESSPEGSNAALVGSSWGAMLALAYAAAHPDHRGPLVLIGCGTFDRAARAQYANTVAARTDDCLRRRLKDLARQVVDPDARLEAESRLILPLYSCDPVTDDLELVECDARGNREAWGDMLRLQADGVYPAAFAGIRSSVLMLHGADDPHPGRMIRASLDPYLPQLEYREWDRCGHYPWLERAVGEEFFRVLREWLRRHAPSGGPG